MKKASSLILKILVLVVAVGALATSAYFYREYQKIKKNPDLVAKEEAKAVTDNIKKYMELPSEEEPTLATITDKEKLKDQEFFKNAQNGDKVLIYTKARKAILYRPSTNRVIEFAPLVIGTDNAGVQGANNTNTQQNQPENIKVAIYNGTKTAGLTAEYEKKLADVNNIAVTDKQNAAKDNYTKTVVVDLSGQHKDLANQISQLLGGEIKDQVPEGENKPQADILVIAGK